MKAPERIEASLQKWKTRRRSLLLVTVIVLAGLLGLISQSFTALPTTLGEKRRTTQQHTDSGLINSSDYRFNEAESSVMQLLDEYKRKHSVRILQQEYEGLPMNKNFLHRRFVKGMYSCPHQAGNRLFHFLNAFVYAVVTNRTLLWEYCSKDGICPMHGEVSDCDKVLNRAAWIPSIHRQYTAWASELDPPTRVFRESHPKRPEILGRQLVLDEIFHQVLDFGIMEKQECGEVLAEPEAEQVLSKQAHQRAQRLFSAGTSFAYGAMFNAAFSLHPTILESASSTQEGRLLLKQQQQTDDGAISIAIHSRHQGKTDDGSNSKLDELCLEKVYHAVQKATTSSTTQCSVALMTDRETTLRSLTTKAQALGCNVAQAAHSEPGQASFTREHGPFAGVGLFEDLAMAQYATDAVIKTVRSTASNLLAAMIAFHRTRVDRPRAPLITCTMHRQRNECQCT